MAITINVNGVTGGGNNNQPQNNNNQQQSTPPPTQPQMQPNMGGGQSVPPSSGGNYNGGSQQQQTPPPTSNYQPPQQPPTPIRYQRPDFDQYRGQTQPSAQSALPTSDRMVNDIRAEISRRGVILVPGTQNFSTMLNTLQQNQRTNIMGQIDNQYNARIADIDRRDAALYNEIKVRLDTSRQSELAGASSQSDIDLINSRYDRLEDREFRRAGRFFEGEYESASLERNTSKEEAEQRLTEALQRLTEELSQGNKDSYLNNLRDKYKEQIWRRDNAYTEDEVKEASREAAKIQERMQRAMNAGASPNMTKWLGVAGTVASTAINTGVQLDRLGIREDYLGFDMSSSVLNGNAFAALRQQNALKQQQNSAIYSGLGTAGGATIGAAIGSAFGGVGAIPGYVIGGLIGTLVGTGVGQLGSHLANRGLMIEDERTKMAELWKQEENRIMGFNDLVMLTRGRYNNPNDIEGIRNTIIDSTGRRPFVYRDVQSEPGFLEDTWSTVKGWWGDAKEFLGIGEKSDGLNYEPSNWVKNRIARQEGDAMYKSTIDPLSGKLVGKNASFEDVANNFKKALPANIREQVLSNQDLADNLYSYYYNVKPETFRKQVVPALEKYYAGEGSIDDITSSMWASGDKKLRGLRIRREQEKEGVRRALSGGISLESRKDEDYSNYQPQVDVWRRSESNLDLYDLGYTAPEFAQQVAKRIKQRGFVDNDSETNALYADALERIFSMSPGALGSLSKYDRFGRNNANQDFANLVYTLDRLGTTGMRNGSWARSDEFAQYMTQLQQSQRSAFLTVDNARVGRQVATGQAIFGDKFGNEAMQAIQQVNDRVQNPGGGFQQTLLYDVIQELFPDTRGRIDKIEQAQYDPAKQNAIQQAYYKRIQSIYGSVDTASGYLAMQEITGIKNPNVMMPIAKQLVKRGGLEAQKLDTSHNVESEVQLLNNGYTPKTTQDVNSIADQQMKSLLHYQETITQIVQNILDKIETSIAEKLSEAVDNLK